MDGKFEGTPNPLNPAPGTANNTAQPASFAQASGATSITGVPVNNAAAQPTAGTQTSMTANAFSSPAAGAPSGSAMPEIQKAAPTSAMPNIPTAKPGTTHGMVDPMMRPVSRPGGTNGNAGASMNGIGVSTVQNNRGTGTFVGAHLNSANEANGGTNTPTMDNISVDDLRGAMNPASDPGLVARDSVVEPTGGKRGNKKPLIIGAIVLIAVAIVCGVAAVVIALTSGNGNAVSRAIEKMLTGEASSVVSLKGTANIEYIGDEDSDTNPGAALDIEATFDFAEKTNEVELKAEILNMTPTYSNPEIYLNELTDKNGDTYLKISGISSLLDPLTNGPRVYTVDETEDEEETETTEEDEIIQLDDGEYLEENSEESPNCSRIDNCIPEVTEDGPIYPSGNLLTSVLAMYAGFLSGADDEWILLSHDEDSSIGITLADDEYMCYINSFNTLASYGKDLATKYSANPFITATTENLGINKKKNELYKLGLNTEKLNAFISAAGNNGFFTQIKSCSDDDSLSISDFINEFFSNFSTIYTEIDENDNITRLYLEESNEDAIFDADLNVYYPTSFTAESPEEYTTFSEIIIKMMTNTEDNEE